MTLRHESVRANGGAHLRWACWAEGDVFNEFEAALETDPSVVSAASHTHLSDRRLYEIVLECDPRSGVFAYMVENGLHILDAELQREQTRLRIRCPDRGCYRELRDLWIEEYGRCATRSIASETPEGRNGPPLTEKQREVLCLAIERGYFDVPRTCDLNALSDELGISESAASQRIRRGVAALLEAYCDGEVRADGSRA